MPARHAGRAEPARGAGAAPINLTHARFANRCDFAAGGCA